MGEIEEDKKKVLIIGKGLNSLIQSKHKINLGNSGTSARLLIGLLSSQNFNSTLVGDSSLSKRPMGRITEPLELMGAKFISDKNKLPLKIIGQKLKNINYELKLPSAQVKSGLIFAALNTEGISKIIEKINMAKNLFLEKHVGKINENEIIPIPSLVIVLTLKFFFMKKNKINGININIPSGLTRNAKLAEIYER